MEKIYDYHVNSFGYERDNVAAALSKDNIATFFIMEGTAEAHSDMITLAGAEAPKFAPKMDVSIRFEDDGYEVDNGHVYHYTLSNNTDAPIQRYAALVSYLPNLVKVPEFDEATRTFVIKENAQQVFHGQIHAIDIDLAADESVTMPIISNFYGLSALSILWIDFESLSERDEFLKDPIFYGISTPDIQGYRAIDMLTGAAWMKATLGITINPAK